MKHRLSPTTEEKGGEYVNTVSAQATVSQELKDPYIKRFQTAGYFENGVDVRGFLGSTIDNSIGSEQPSDSDSVLQNAVSILVNTKLEIVTQSETVIGSQDRDLAVQSVSAADIEGLFYRNKVDVSASRLDLSESTVLLLRNGLAFIGLRTSPLDIQIPHTIESTDKRWTQWRISEGTYEMKNQAGTWEPIDGVKVDTTPLQPSEITGTYSSIRSQNWAGTVFTNMTNLSLSDDGKFLNSSSSLNTAVGAESSVLDSTITVYNSHNSLREISVSTGSHSANPDNTVIASFHESVVKVMGDMIGSYSLLEDGLTIEFQFANGNTKRELIFRPGPDSHLYVGNKLYDRNNTVKTNSIYTLISDSYQYFSSLLGGDWQSALREASKKNPSEKAPVKPRLDNLPRI